MLALAKTTNEAKLYQMILFWYVLNKAGKLGVIGDGAAMTCHGTLLHLQGTVVHIHSTGIRRHGTVISMYDTMEYIHGMCYNRTISHIVVLLF